MRRHESGRRSPTFRRNVLPPPFSGSKSESSKKQVARRQAALTYRRTATALHGVPFHKTTVFITFQFSFTEVCRFWMVLTMVYNIQNYLVFWLCPSSGILETGKRNVSETGSVSIPKWGGGTYSIGYFRRCLRVQWLRLALSNGPKRVGDSLLTWRRKYIQFPKRCVLKFLECRMTDKDQKPNNSDWSLHPIRRVLFNQHWNLST
jgi:hypothetical protein